MACVRMRIDVSCGVYGWDRVGKGECTIYECHDKRLLGCECYLEFQSSFYSLHLALALKHRIQPPRLVYPCVLHCLTGLRLSDRLQRTPNARSIYKYLSLSLSLLTPLLHHTAFTPSIRHIPSRAQILYAFQGPRYGRLISFDHKRPERTRQEHRQLIHAPAVRDQRQDLLDIKPGGETLEEFGCLRQLLGDVGEAEELFEQVGEEDCLAGSG